MFQRLILPLLLLLHLAHAIRLAPTPSATSAPIQPTNADPTKALAARCGDGDCTFGGTATTLQAATVTTTILSTTSVPCYITTYVTDSTTTTSTVYSTDTITSTVTKDNTVFVYKYSPTPVLMSSVYESVLEFTQTYTSYWQTESGAAYESTVTGDSNTLGGGVGGGNGEGVISTADATDSAWTHAAADNAGTTVGGNGWAAAAGTTPVGAAGTAGGNGVAVSWGNGSGRSVGGGRSGWSGMVVMAAMSVVMVWP